MIFLQTAAWLKMTVERADVKTAFLQGRPIERDLFVVPVPELAEGLGLSPGEAAKLLKSSYGLVDAPLEWFLTVVDVFAALGWQQLTSDPCALVLLDRAATGNEVTISAACWHVDDFEFAGRATNKRWTAARDQVKQALKWQEWERDDYVQLWVRTRQRMDHSVCLEQRSYVLSIEPIEIDPQRKRMLEEKATEQETS